MTNFPPIYAQVEKPPENPSWTKASEKITNDDVAALLARWRFERKKFPGWIVTPENKRSTVWFITKRWSDALIKFVDTWNAVDRLLVYREINWRLEVSMVPLFTNWIEPFKQALFASFEDILERKPIADSPWFARFDGTKEQEALRTWLEIGLGLLREARETYNAEYWNQLHDKIGQLIGRDEQLSDRWHYENALWAVWNIERERAKSILEDWQPTPSRPLANIWKAGLLAELGEVDEPRELLREAFGEIRNAENMKGQDISLFSQEAWCMYLLSAIERSHDWSAKQAREFLERWQELKSWDCDPWTTKEALEKPLLDSKPQVADVQRVQHFDPDMVSVSYHLGGDMDGYLPAFAYIRFFEDTGTPLRLPHLNIAGDALKIACDWIAPFMGFWSPALLVRADKLEDLTKKSDFLSRTRVATMEADLVHRVYSWCIAIWDREVENYKRSNRRDRSSLLTCLAEILSRLALRMGEEQLQEMFERATAIWPFCGHQADSLTSACDAWFKRLFDTASPDLLLRWLPSLLSLPLSRRDDDNSDSYWSDPMDAFPSKRVEKTELETEPSVRLTEAVETLLMPLPNEASSARNRRLMRLIQLHEAGKLSSAQTSAFGESLWRHRHQNGLPALNWLRWSDFLSLPHPNDVDVAAIIKTNILAAGPFDGGAIICNSNGSVGLAGVRAPAPIFIYEAGHASKAFVHVVGEGEGRIEWTDLEAAELYLRAIEWWSKAKIGCSRKFAGFGEVDKKALGRQVARFLTRVVMPKFQALDGSQREALFAWLADLRDSSVYVSPALPYLIAQQSTEADKFTSMLINDLRGTDEGAVSAASASICHYVSLTEGGHISHTDEELVRALTERISFRRNHSLQECLVAMTRLLVQSPESVEKNDISFLSDGLKAWSERLSLQAGPNSEFTVSERPILLYQIGCLSGVMSALYSYLGLPIPVNVVEWQTICAESKLPDVRRAFLDGVQFFDAERKRKPKKKHKSKTQSKQ